MYDDISLRPDTVLATDDPGDETARRYWYQWTYAAIICCMLLDETEDTIEVFCEHHEDILIKHIDGTFSGLQIKTRASNQDVWKTSDDAVRDSCVRFAKLEAQFPGYFCNFRFMTNHILHSVKNGQDFCYVLQTIRASTSINSLAGAVKTFFNHIVKKSGCEKGVVFAALSKTYAYDSLPKISDSKSRLVDTLVHRWTRGGDCTYPSISRIASYLTMKCGEASSLAHQDLLPAYLPATTSPIEKELVARIKGKCINRLQLLEILEDGLNKTAALNDDPVNLVEPGTGTVYLLTKKLEAGGFSVISRNSARDLRNKADYLGTCWTKKYGYEEGLQRWGHVRSLVLSDAARCFEATQSEEHSFGLDMLSQLRSRFQQRRIEGEQFHDCSNEHLEGVAYCLTSECEIRWSLDSPWETD